MFNFQQVSRAMRVSRSALELPPRDFKYVASKSNIRWGNGETRFHLWWNLRIAMGEVGIYRNNRCRSV